MTFVWMTVEKIMVAIWKVDNSTLPTDELLLVVRSSLGKSSIFVTPQYQSFFVDLFDLGIFFQLLV